MRAAVNTLSTLIQILLMIFKGLMEAVKPYLDCPVKCLVCQFRVILALNGDGTNEETFKKWGWVKLPE